MPRSHNTPCWHQVKESGTISPQDHTGENTSISTPNNSTSFLKFSSDLSVIKSMLRAKCLVPAGSSSTWGSRPGWATARLSKEGCVLHGSVRMLTPQKTTQGAGYVRSEGLLLSCWEHWRWHTDKQSTAEICGTGSTGQTQRHRSQA